MRSSSRLRSSSILIAFAASTWGASAAAGPPAGPHPRLFMSADQIAGYKANAKVDGTAAASLVAACDDTITEPKQYAERGGSDGDYWPGSAMRCAFAYEATGDSKYLTQALLYWHASLDDDQKIGDGQGCKAGVDPNWQSWDGNPPAPPIIRTITHDTGYPMRWYGPDIALTYDWLHDAPGVDAALQTQTTTCLGAWNDYYTANGYHHDQAGANYNAGFVIAKTLGAIAIGTDNGADGHLWTETTTDLFPNLLVGQGLVGAADPVGQPAGAIAGGDWAEGWEYGPLSVLEYAVATRSLKENGAPFPDMDAWTNALAVRYIHGTVPTLDGQWVGGDFDDENVYADPNVNELDAVLAGTSSDEAASWAAFMKQAQAPTAGTYFYNALAELRTVTPADYTAQSPAPSRWYLARGTRALYARTSWQKDAIWGVFSSPPMVVDDHEHLAASNWVLSRGADHLVVDPSNYGEPSSLETNAVTAKSTVAKDDYAPSQTPFSEAELLWARGTDDAVYAARSDFAKAFIFSSTPSDISYAHREWVLLPEGEVVTIDRVHTQGADDPMIVGFHTNTGSGGLKLNGAVASGTVGGSAVAIHAVKLSGGTPAITQPEVGSCSLSCDYPCGPCDAARFAVDKYTVSVPGPIAVAIHVIDALGASEAPATVGAIDDDTYDPAPKQNGDVIGAAISRSSKQSYVIASSATDGASPATMTYGVPGNEASRHVVFDAPEDASGASNVTATATGGRCVITITAGAAIAGHPLMFGVSDATGGCVVTASTDVPAGPPPGSGGSSSTSGGSTATGSGGAAPAGGSAVGAGGANGAGNSSAGASGATAAAASSDSGGCGCGVGERPDAGFGVFALLGAIAARRGSRRGA